MEVIKTAQISMGLFFNYFNLLMTKNNMNIKDWK